LGVPLVHVPAHVFAIALAVLACSRPAPAQTPDTSPAQDDQSQDETATLDTLHVTAQRPPTAHDQLRERLQRNWHPPRSAEQFGLDGGVPAWLGQQMVRGMTAATRTLPGWKREVQPAIARPPPLDDTQMDRTQALQPASPLPGAQPR
jgi:hypothetical protein